MIFSLFCLLTSVLSFSFGLFCLIKNPRRPTNVAFFANSVAISLWSLGLGFLVVAPSQQVANSWITVHYIGASLIPATFALYVYVFLGIVRERRLLLVSWWLIGAAFLILTITKRHLFISAAAAEPFFTYYTKGELL